MGTRMNERIKELLVKADIKFDRDINEIEVCVMLPSDLEKFAELIVRECADIATINQHEWHSAGSYVLKHFGFEK